MKRMLKRMNVRSPRTLGELVTMAYDVTPSSAAAVKLLGMLLHQRAVRFAHGRKPGI